MAVGGKVYHVDPDYPDITLSPGVKYLFKYVIYFPYRLDKNAKNVPLFPDDIISKLASLDKIIAVPHFSKVCGYSHYETPFVPEWTYSSEVVFCITVDSQVKVTAKTIGVALQKAIQNSLSHVLDNVTFTPPLSTTDHITVLPTVFVDGATDTTQQSLDLISGAHAPAAGLGTIIPSWPDLPINPTEIITAIAIGIAIGIVLNLFSGG